VARLALAAALAASLMALLVPQTGRSRTERRSAVQTADIMLAFDATHSMEPSIAAAQRDAQEIISSVTPLAPGTRFAVASFRDRYYPGGEYTLLSHMTGNVAELVAAIQRLKAVSTTNPAVVDYAEAYNRLFHETYTDPDIGWRPASRKIVMVIGDAEPHSAGADGLAGCRDTTKDWDGLDTAKELAAMKAAKRTLVMVLQTATASTSLSCYSSLAAAAYTGGTAVEGSSRGIAKPVLALVEHAYAPLMVTPQLSGGLAGSTESLTIGITNANAFPLAVTGLTLTLPRGLSFVARRSTGNLPAPTARGSVLTWARGWSLARGQSVLENVVVRAGSNITAGPVSAQLTAATPQGIPLTVSSKAKLKFVRHVHSVAVKASGRRGTASVRGTLTSKIGHSGGSGALVLSLGAGKSVTLRPASATIGRAGAPTTATMRLVVSHSSGVAGCGAGASGVLHLVDSDALTKSGRTHDRLVFELPATCGGTNRFTDSSAHQPLLVTLRFS
jgi:hypothetical protein